jgi:hypothetical protein
VPEGHEEHDTEPAVFEYVFNVHGIHTSSLVPRVPEKLVPGGHFKHTGNPKPEYVPAPHTTQELDELIGGPT